METTEPVIRREVDVKVLLEAGVHFGHQTRRWNPKMKPFIFGARNGIYIIDLAKTLVRLQEAKQFLSQTVTTGRKILFVGTKKQAQEQVKKSAEALGQPYVVNRWLGGMLTNNRTIRQSVARMRKLDAMEADGTMEKLPKKEVAGLRHELEKLHKNLSGVADMDNLPGAMFVVDICRDAIAVQEANRLGIPVVAMVDTNVNPDPIAYPIPANDDAIRSIQVILEDVTGSVRGATEQYAQAAAEAAQKRAIQEAEERAHMKAVEEERKLREREARKARQEAIVKAKAAKIEAAPAAPTPEPAPEPAVQAAPDAPESPAAAEPAPEADAPKAG